MKIVPFMKKAVAGSAAGVALIKALPFFGPVGTITTKGIAVASLVGAIASMIDEWESQNTHHM